jgi:hypothetical protein
MHNAQMLQGEKDSNEVRTRIGGSNDDFAAA